MRGGSGNDTEVDYRVFPGSAHDAGPPPLIDWSARLRPGDLPVGSAAGGSWKGDFTTELGRSSQERNPNQRIRLTVPVGGGGQ